MNPARAGGVLLHLTSLPGPDGIGDLGADAQTWIRWLASAGLGLWQFLPFGPVGPSGSPYQSPSTFAGNPLLISLNRLEDEGWLSSTDLDRRRWPDDRVDLGEVTRWKATALRQAAKRWRERGRPGLDEFEAWCAGQRGWLDDYAMFMAIKEASGGARWNQWESELARRLPTALARARSALAEPLEAHRLQQYWFFRQWDELAQAARHAGIALVGDLPIYVAYDSADVWSRRDLYQLDPDGNPTVVAGVPPDYFSETGQLWSNPIYDWERHRQEGFAWWTARVAHLARLVDRVRLDHFRGLEAYWAVPADHETAVEGRWVAAPGEALLRSLQSSLGDLPLIAEDLGVITQDVERLRDSFGLPGMRVMQFGLEAGEGDAHLPERYPERCVAYTGTHDNDTSLGWYRAASPTIQDFARRHLSSDGHDIGWRMIEAIWTSSAGWSLAPMQDLLGLGSEARMNTPGTTAGNWTWRLPPGEARDSLAERIREMGRRSGRGPAADG